MKKKDKSEVVANCVYYGIIALMVSAVLAFIIAVLVNEFGG